MNFETHTRHFTLKYSNKMQKALSILKDHVGINYFSYCTISPSGHRSAIKSNPQFDEYYNAEKLYLDDPLLRCPENYTEGAMFWPTDRAMNKSKFCHSTQLQFNMHFGLSIVRKSPFNPGGFDVFNFTAPEDQTAVLNFYINNMDILHRFVDFFKVEFSTIIKKMHSNPVDLKAFKGNRYEEIEPFQLGLPSSKKYLINSQLKVVDSTKYLDNPYFSVLTTREKKCISLYFSGETATSSALILGLSQRTVEHYLDSVRNKLGCQKKSDLFRLLIGSLLLKNEKN